jgi:hypothetical protein
VRLTLSQQAKPACCKVINDLFSSRKLDLVLLGLIEQGLDFSVRHACLVLSQEGSEHARVAGKFSNHNCKLLHFPFSACKVALLALAPHHNVVD